MFVREESEIMPGQLIDGKWETGVGPAHDTRGHFVRRDSSFRSWITPDGAAGPTGEAVSRRRPGAITSMSPTPAPGRIAR